MQEPLRNASGKPTTVESLDKRDRARVTRSANPITGHEAIDRDYEKNRVKQAKATKTP